MIVQKFDPKFNCFQQYSTIFSESKLARWLSVKDFWEVKLPQQDPPVVWVPANNLYNNYKTFLCACVFLHILMPASLVYTVYVITWSVACNGHIRMSLLEYLKADVPKQHKIFLTSHALVFLLWQLCTLIFWMTSFPLIVMIFHHIYQGALVAQLISQLSHYVVWCIRYVYVICFSIWWLQISDTCRVGRHWPVSSHRNGLCSCLHARILPRYTALSQSKFIFVWHMYQEIKKVSSIHVTVYARSTRTATGACMPYGITELPATWQRQCLPLLPQLWCIAFSRVLCHRYPASDLSGVCCSHSAIDCLRLESVTRIAFSTSTLLIGWQEWHLACKN